MAANLLRDHWPCFSGGERVSWLAWLARRKQIWVYSALRNQFSGQGLLGAKFWPAQRIWKAT